jgi:Tfp pilus assembly protein PilV
MVALFIFLVIMLGLAKGEIAALSTQSGNTFRNEALRLAEDELSRLKGERFSLSGTSAELAPATWSAPQNITVNMRKGSITFARSVQITDIAGGAAVFKRIDVAVGWTQGNNATLAPTNRNHQTSVSTLIVRGD